MMSTATLLFLIASSQFLLSVQGVTLRLKGNETIPNDGSGEVDINELPVGGCRRYETLECLSDVKYRGRQEDAYWVYTDPSPPFKEFRVDDIRCKAIDNCNDPDFGWLSIRAIHKKGSNYYGALRLGRHFANATVGSFTCVFEGDSNPRVSLTIIKNHDPQPAKIDDKLTTILDSPTSPTPRK